MNEPRLRSIESLYRVDSGRLPRELAFLFARLGPDAEAESFLELAERTRASWARTRLHGLLVRILSDFDVNGLLGMYPMHLLSREQWQQLLGRRRFESLLDIGAGSGDVTLQLAPLFDRVFTTERSRVMCSRLKRRGFTCELRDLTRDELPEDRFSVVSLLNVLDRCARPRTLLKRALDALKPEGLLVVALAFPYKPFYYDGPRALDPEEVLPCHATDWETNLVTLVRDVFEPLGLSPIAWARAPYLSAGDSKRELYVLDDAVLVLRR